MCGLVPCIPIFRGGGGVLKVQKGCVYVIKLFLLLVIFKIYFVMCKKSLSRWMYQIAGKTTAHLGHRIFESLPIICISGFKRREKWIIVYQTENKYPLKLSLLRIWCPSSKFFFVLFRTIKLKGEVNVFIRKFSKVSYFPTAVP